MAGAAARAFFFGATAWLGGLAEEVYGRKDPPQVTSDEVAGQLFGLAFTSTTGAGFWTRAAAGFCLFRLFDIWKPGPIRRLERLPGGLGIAADDAAAGVLANLVLQLGLRVGMRLWA